MTVGATEHEIVIVYLSHIKSLDFNMIAPPSVLKILKSLPKEGAWAMYSYIHQVYVDTQKI